MEHQDFLRQMIAEYRKKIEMYEGMIREWELELGSSVPPSSEKPQHVTLEGANSIVSRISSWHFYGKSQPEAVKALLEMTGHPLTTDQIIEYIERGGVKVGGKNEKDKRTNLYTILHRSEDFKRIAKRAWGLPGWPGAQGKVKKDETNKKDNDSNGGDNQ